jgi:hypothetical protein
MHPNEGENVSEIKPANSVAYVPRLARVTQSKQAAAGVLAFRW